MLALQTQINPHFLYNTLNGFIALNRLNEKKKLEDSIIRLTSMFRYTCSNSGRTTIHGELQFIDAYLALQQLRFGDRLQYHIIVSKDADPIVIPRLLLQPLVENSIIHGMEPSDREFMLEVSVDRIGHPIFGMLTVFTIADNGVGFDAKHLPDTKRIGIKNVADRLELFQDFSFFQIKSVPGSGTWVHIILPEQSSRPDQSSGGMNS